MCGKDNVRNRRRKRSEADSLSSDRFEFLVPRRDRPIWATDSLIETGMIMHRYHWAYLYILTITYIIRLHIILRYSALLWQFESNKFAGRWSRLSEVLEVIHNVRYTIATKEGVGDQTYVGFFLPKVNATILTGQYIKLQKLQNLRLASVKHINDSYN